MKTYYCQCGGRTEVPNGKAKKCNECERTFGTPKMSNYINMRRTLAHTTKIEFSESTVEKSMKKMRKSFK